MIKKTLVVVMLVVLIPSLCVAQEWRPVRNTVKAIVPTVKQQVCNSAAGTCSVQEVRQAFAPTQSPAYTVVSSTPVVTASSTVVVTGVADNLIFRRALLKAASNQRRAGNITIEEYLVIARSARNPAKLQELRDSMADAAVEEGLVTTAAINWDGLIAFIEKLLPIILKLIDMFGYNASDVQGLCFLSGTSVMVTMNDDFSFMIGV